jgi:hypothetical protein
MMGQGPKMTQVAILVEDLRKTDAEVREFFSFEEGYHEPGMAQFGLENTVHPLADRQYLEICGQLKDAGAGRRVGGRRGSGGYMAIVEVPRREDIETCRRRLEAQGLRVVHEIEQESYHSIHVHPRDLGTLVSFDWCAGHWPGIAPDWPGPVRTEVVGGIMGVELRSASPETYANRWATTLGLPVEHGTLTLPGDGTVVRFAGGRTEEQAGLDVIDFRASDRGRYGETRDMGGVEFRLV